MTTLDVKMVDGRREAWIISDLVGGWICAEPDKDQPAPVRHRVDGGGDDGRGSGARDGAGHSGLDSADAEQLDAEAVVTDEDHPATLEQAVRDEQEWLWADMTNAVATAHNGCWSVQCENLTDRIVTLARFVGATRWSAVDCTLLRSGVYERILTEAGIAYEPIDWAAVEKTEASIARSAWVS